MSLLHAHPLPATSLPPHLLDPHSPRPCRGAPAHRRPAHRRPAHRRNIHPTASCKASPSPVASILSNTSSAFLIRPPRSRISRMTSRAVWIWLCACTISRSPTHARLSALLLLHPRAWATPRATARSGRPAPAHATSYRTPARCLNLRQSACASPFWLPPASARARAHAPAPAPATRARRAARHQHPLASGSPAWSYSRAAGLPPARLGRATPPPLAPPPGSRPAPAPRAGRVPAASLCCPAPEPPRAARPAPAWGRPRAASRRPSPRRPAARRGREVGRG
jgi:hypothetical protein